jgi:hypothetical protein
MILRPEQIRLLRLGMPSIPANGGGDAPEADPNVGIAAMKSAEMGEKWYEFASKIYEESKPRQAQMDGLTTELARQGLSTSRFNDEKARGMWERYESTVVPMEDDFFAEARRAGSAAEQDKAAGEASTDVRAATQTAREGTARAMMRMGVRPDSGRFAQANVEQDAQTALLDSAARNTARTTERSRGIQLRAGAVQVGKGMPITAGGTFGVSQNAGTGATGALLSGGNMEAARTGIMTSGMQGAMQGYNQQAGILNQDYSNRLKAWDAEQHSDDAFWGAVGSLGGAALGKWSDRRLKQNIERVGTLPNGLAWYAFDYVWGGERQHGVMADEVEKVMPEAVMTHGNGYKLVNYSLLGVQ